MKHIGKYIGESIFDDVKATDKVVLADELDRIFRQDLRGKIEIRPKDNVLKIWSEYGVRLNGKTIKQACALLPGVDTIKSRLEVHITGLKNFNRYISNVNSAGLLIKNCTGIDNCNFKSTDCIEIRDTPKVTNSTLTTHKSMVMESYALELSLYNGNDHLIFTGIKTNAKYLTIRKYKSWDIQADSIECVNVWGGDTGSAYGKILDDLIADLIENKFRPLDMKDIFDEHRNDLAQLNPAKDLHFDLPHLKYIEWSPIKGPSCSICMFSPEYRASNYLIKKLNKYTWRTYELANGWKLIYEPDR